MEINEMITMMDEFEKELESKFEEMIKRYYLGDNIDKDDLYRLFTRMRELSDNLRDNSTGWTHYVRANEHLKVKYNTNKD